jgi:hypothetical protein
MRPQVGEIAAETFVNETKLDGTAKFGWLATLKISNQAQKNLTLESAGLYCLYIHFQDVFAAVFTGRKPRW